MKEVHLVCNAHLDPIWQWEWEEGAASALATFRAAADLADEFDYIFCHNEVTVYKYIEEYAPALFERIKVLVRKGKWHIMGGWYLQPDCNMPLGESFVRQIQMGHRYFREKFGVEPTTAINFDPFGHSVGLPQIISKCGQDSYLIMRAGADPLPDRTFLWESPDGSRIKVHATPFGYNSPLGHAAEAIRKRAEALEGDTVCVLWGVGNHGGGPSRRDLADIEELKKENLFSVLHSTPELYFAQVDPKAVHRKSLHISNPGCYTSQARVKQKHAETENTLYMVEKLCSAAALQGIMEYPEKELDEATEALLNSEFHDVLPGSSVRAGEENGILLLDYALTILNRLRARAFFALSAAQEKAKEGEYPVLVFNPQPYPWKTEVFCEFSLADQNWSETSHAKITVLDSNGKVLPLQTVKEESNLNLDWRKKICFRAVLAPLAVTRFSVYIEYVPVSPRVTQSADGNVTVEADGRRMVVDGKTGLLTSFCVDGREYLKGGAFRPYFWEDNPDPWGMGDFQLKQMGRNPQPFALSAQPAGPFSGLASAEVIEDGELYTAVECFFERESTKVRIEYDLWKTGPFVDIKADVFMQDANRLLKLAVPCAGEGDYIGQGAYCTEPLYTDGRECVAQRFVAWRCGGKCLAVLNRGTYGSSCEDGVISLSLLRGATYCAHPIQKRPILPEGKFTKKIDMGERNFAFRLCLAEEEELERLAAEFNHVPYALNVFPISVQTERRPFTLSVSDRNVVLEAFKKQTGGQGYVLRLMNNAPEGKTASVSLNDGCCTLHFGKYEVKTLLWDGTRLTESPRMVI